VRLRALVTAPLTLNAQAVALQERFILARRNCGAPHGITYLVTYPAPAALPSVPALAARVAELQERFPLLYARIADAQTRAPRFEARTVPWPANAIVHHARFEPDVERVREQERILFAEIERMGAADFEMQPLWRVCVLTADTPGARAHLAVSVAHELTDGMGLLALVDALLVPSITALPHEALDKLPALEETLDLRPALRDFVPVVWRELVVPLLPAFLRAYLTPPRPWPVGVPGVRPLEAPWGLSLLALPPALVPALKAAGAAHGVRALHTTLQVAYTLALAHVCGRAGADFAVETAVPMSERSAELGHAHCTRNYISVHMAPLALRPGDDFWARAAALAADLHSPVGRARARGTMGMLAWIPDPVPDAAMRASDTPTGWERFTLEKAAGPEPYGQGLGVSNLGAVHLPPGAEDAVWAQAASPYLGPLGAQVVGHAGGLRISTVWREGAPVTADEVARIERVLEGVLGRLANEGWTETQLETLTAGL
jgi:hypothetical protein